jgi:Ulp1 family protease
LLVFYKKLLEGYWKVIRPGTPTPKWKTKMIKPPASPAQKDGFSCGVFVCAFMDLYSVGIPVSNFQALVNRRNIGEVRRRLAAFLLNLSYT